MKKISLFLTIGFCAATSFAQTEKPSAEKSATGEEHELSEDLETLAALLSEDLHRSYANSEGGPHDGRSDVWETPLVEHLPDYGVIIQMRILPPSNRAEGAQPAARRWQSTQNRLRGIPNASVRRSCQECHSGTLDAAIPWPIDPRDPWHAQVPTLRKALAQRLHAAAPTRGEVVEVVLATVRENAANIRHLTPDQRVTISLSYDRTQGHEQKLSGGGSNGVEAAFADFDRVLIGRIDDKYSLTDMEAFLQLTVDQTEFDEANSESGLAQPVDKNKKPVDTSFPRFVRVRISTTKRAIDQVADGSISKDDFRKLVTVTWTAN